MIQPTDEKPESKWREEGYEFYHCKCGHRYFSMGMAPKDQATIGLCEWCIKELDK